ncbi:hypothetical protein SAMN04487924_12887 [Bacteroides xylanisolvens]|jgi:hypothetical protein|uniref:Uncharacterized protein n=1 Tax=Bacteroides xylanisolvens TaxID=371601 RepID=A0A1H4GGD4_9BACE|nr:hypothetical protein SAMN04487924_12887 [Bacteroides xylanisolvens]
MLRLAFDFIIAWREIRARPNAYCQPTGQLQSAFPKQALKIQQSNDLSA